MTKKPVTKKPVTKKPVTKKSAAKKPVTKKPVTKKSAAKKSAAKPKTSTLPDGKWSVTQYRSYVLGLGTKANPQKWASGEVIATVNKQAGVLTILSYKLPAPPAPPGLQIDPARPEHLQARGNPWLTIAAPSANDQPIAGVGTLTQMTTTVTLPTGGTATYYLLREALSVPDPAGTATPINAEAGLFGVVVPATTGTGWTLYLAGARKIGDVPNLTADVKSDTAVQTWISALGASYVIPIATTPAKFPTLGLQFTPGWHAVYSDPNGKNLLWAVWVDDTPSETWYQYGGAGLGSQTTTYWFYVTSNEQGYTPPSGYSGYYHAINNTKAPAWDGTFQYYYSVTDAAMPQGQPNPFAMVGQDDPVAPTRQTWWFANSSSTYQVIQDTQKADTITVSSIPTASANNTWTKFGAQAMSLHSIKAL